MLGFSLILQNKVCIDQTMNRTEIVQVNTHHELFLALWYYLQSLNEKLQTKL